MRLAKLMMAVAACSLATTPALAAPQAAKADVARVATASGEANAQDGGFPFLIVFVVVAVGLGIYAATQSDDTPTSP